MKHPENPRAGCGGFGAAVMVALAATVMADRVTDNNGDSFCPLCYS